MHTYVRMYVVMWCLCASHTREIVWFETVYIMVDYIGAFWPCCFHMHQVSFRFYSFSAYSIRLYLRIFFLCVGSIGVIKKASYWRQYGQCISCVKIDWRNSKANPEHKRWLCYWFIALSNRNWIKFWSKIRWKEFEFILDGSVIQFAILMDICRNYS